MATIPVGYGDGYPRALSNKGYVLVHGKKAPIIGRVCMDQFMVDVSDIPEAMDGDIVTLAGKDGAAVLSVEELADMAGSFHTSFCVIWEKESQEFITGTGKRYAGKTILTKPTKHFKWYTS